MSLNIGDIFEVDGQRLEVVNVTTTTKNDGSTVEVVTSRNVV